MWKSLPEDYRNEYKKLILAFASLTDMFSQKSDGEEVTPSPIVNSKFQETVFQKALHAVGEDIGNTSFDASIRISKSDGSEEKYLVGIKTFGISSGDQKIAQFKTNHNEWAVLIDQMEKNAHDGASLRTKEEIDLLNHDLYLDLAKKISNIRNERIMSSKECLRGFQINNNDDVYCVYHVLMPSKKGQDPKIYVGETLYSPISVEDIRIIGCTSSRNPTNFIFEDGVHTYKYTAADSQLYMKFNNKDIVLEDWDVIYADDAHDIFSEIASKIYSQNKKDHELHTKYKESHSWSLFNSHGEVEMFSGYNSFFGIGSKLGKAQRDKTINHICKEISEKEQDFSVHQLNSDLSVFLTEKASSSEEKMKKAELRKNIVMNIQKISNPELIAKIKSLLFRPSSEMYIPIPNSKQFHREYPDFFGKGIAEFEVDEATGKELSKLKKEKQDREFNLIFEPSGNSIKSFITQDNGKAIESVEKQTYLGEWILRKVFQLKEHEPLTVQKLNELEINGIRLYKLHNSNDIHLKFIWIDKDNLPEDYWDKSL